MAKGHELLQQLLHRDIGSRTLSLPLYYILLVIPTVLYTIIILLPYTAIIREIGIGGDRVEELLNCGRGKFDANFLSRALEFAIQMDSAINVGKVALACPSNVTSDLKPYVMLAEREQKCHARAMLLLISAAMSGDNEILNYLSLIVLDDGLYCDRFSVYVRSNEPIRIAQQNDQIQMMNELLMKTDVYPDEGYICWTELQLCELNISLLRKISWVRQLKLSQNSFTTLPQEMCEYLTQV